MSLREKSRDKIKRKKQKIHQQKAKANKKNLAGFERKLTTHHMQDKVKKLQNCSFLARGGGVGVVYYFR
ncbi:hypothetical protein HAX54_038758 [Datura stramonium]|uniref:Uncharacterized protein n=1 Tax=Datura stramonium TaxID=4076 RepID=A0ABS8VLI6_DATST|nr:hypothetical protein [Datura stramonium]